jgi:hypothetical protein
MLLDHIVHPARRCFLLCGAGGLCLALKLLATGSFALCDGDSGGSTGTFALSWRRS